MLEVGAKVSKLRKSVSTSTLSSTGWQNLMKRGDLKKKKPKRPAFVIYAEGVRDGVGIRWIRLVIEVLPPTLKMDESLTAF